MKTLLRIDASALLHDSHSKNLADYLQTQWQAQTPSGQVIHRDLSLTPPPHISESVIGAIYSQEKTAEQETALSLSNELIAELQQADLIVISTPMYNFGIPSTLKAYFDHVARPGETFTFTEQGPQGLLVDKKVINIITSGGDYRQPPLNAMNFVDDYLKTILSFIGLKEITPIHAVDMAKSADEVSLTLTSAKSNIQNVLKGI